MGLKEIPKHYEPAAVEEKWNREWNEKGYFHARSDSGKKPFAIVIPPPNVTAALHMGHALNNTLQDIIIRYKRKQGYEALWLPGTDHAGIATQNVVERELKKEGKTRHDLGREKFIEKVWEWKHKNRGHIVSQLKKIGSSCDWERERFTLDEGLSNAVKEVFIRLYNKGYIYRGTYMINWCPRCSTALSDEEVDHDEVKGHFWHFKYPLKEGGFVEIATTRPETMLGDTAVAVHPDDERYKNIVGKTVILPLMEREIPVVADDYVDKEFGTGIVKITPAHDPNDYEVGKRHGLPEINILNSDGTLNDSVGRYAGMDRFEARKAVVEDMKKLGLLIKVAEHDHSVGHCQRCHTVVEPIISTQWFVNMKEMAKPAVEAVKKGEIKLHPNNRGYKNYMNWMENIRDWCISRQLWWGHRIPVYYCEEHGHENVAREKPEKCSVCGSVNLRQDEDVLDTWFSSWLWPFSTLGWPDKTEDLEFFYPTDVLVTAQDILFFWVARMIMAGYEFMGEKPFKHVLLNGIVRDEQGRKMSKSLGNGIDPIKMVDKYGADAMRYTLIKLSSDGQDINLSEHMLEVGRNFANKIWNAFRFLAMNMENLPDDPEIYISNFNLSDRWILSGLQKTIAEMSEQMEKFRFTEALDVFYKFFWDKYCAWYLELIKERLYRPQKAEEKETALSVAAYVMRQSMDLLHPFMPFISEEIGSFFRRDNDKNIAVSPWPVAKEEWKQREDSEKMDLIRDIITAVRNVRAEMDVPPGKKASLAVVDNGPAAGLVVENKNFIFSLAGIEKLDVLPAGSNLKDSASLVVDGLELFMPLKDLIDVEVELKRLEKERSRLAGLKTGTEKKLANPNFTERAPAQVVEREKEKLRSISENLEKIEEKIKQLN